LLTNANKAIAAITYNHLNLPTQVTMSSGNISYIYDATGVKLEKVVTEGTAITRTNHAGNYVYENDALQFFSTTESYVEPKGLGWEYVFQYKDHLGNIRLSYADSNGDGVIAQTEIREENNYYPFGLKHKGYNNAQTGKDHKYGFGNKEEQEELGLSWIDITARNYDPALGRWMNVDLLAEQMRRHSPYNYAFDNPIYFIDNDGMAPAGFGGIVQFSKTPEPDDFVTKQTNNNDNKLIRELLADNRIIAGNFSQGSSGPGDPPKIFNSKTETAFGEDVVNQLDEVVVNGKSSGAQGGGGWVNPANTTNGGIGLLAGAVENLSGNASLGSNGIIYSSGWGGSQYVSTAKAAKVGKLVGLGTLGIGTVIDGIGVGYYYLGGKNNPNAVHPGKAGLNLGVGAWSLLSPATAIGGIMYYGIDTFYPGGFPAAMEKSAEIQRRDRAILGFYPRD